MLSFVCGGLLLMTGVFLCKQLGDYRAWRKFLYSYTGDYKKIAKMDLDTVLDIYRVNPNRFKVGPIQYGYCFDKHESSRPYILYNTNQENKLVSCAYNIQVKSEKYWNAETTIAIELSRKDYSRFLKWLKNEKKRKDEETNMENIRLILESAQIDIDKIKEKAAEDIRQETKRTMEIMERMVR